MAPVTKIINHKRYTLSAHLLSKREAQSRARVGRKMGYAVRIVPADSVPRQKGVLHEGYFIYERRKAK